ncbi:ATP-grasp domain-containing protein [uncultured Microbulbifer sp.]|uniref:ATP-grasp domain-containing protein n=1 Tax=uncultured Microbulbifer sp. TaxID=348147 RepID=UPI00262B51CB|nr:ATP-grasp domain-containing protein [uncultured Microbulbifer sp.]
MPKHFFVLGLDPLRQSYLERLPDASDYRFHPLFTLEEVVNPATFDYDAMLEKARRTLEAFPEPITGIIAHWDFPSSVLLAHLSAMFGLRAASLESVLKCEHKYWSRLEQQKLMPEWTPGFCAVDPFAEKPLQQLTIDFPFWLKPIKAHSSYLGFRIDNAEQFDDALKKIRGAVHSCGDPFNQALAHISVPNEVEAVDGNWCIAEQILTGKQCGIEGSLLDGEYRVHGIVDTVKDSKNLSFTRYEYPSVWPQYAQEKICEAGEKLLRHMGFDNSPFGIEFFWDERCDSFRILEINTRISQSHCDQFIKVHGVSNHRVPIDLALGRVPDLSQYHGDYQTAAKFMLRRYRDTVLESVPKQAQIESVERDFPDSKIVISADEGCRLSEQSMPDSYSFEIANIWLGAQDQQQLLDTYHQLADALAFRFADGGEPEAFQFKCVRY